MWRNCSLRHREILFIIQLEREESLLLSTFRRNGCFLASERHGCFSLATSVPGIEYDFSHCLRPPEVDLLQFFLA